MTGGCFITNNEAASTCFQITITSKLNFFKRRPMNHKWYGHCSIYANGYVYVIGGFEQKDEIEYDLKTISICEKYHVLEDVWSETGSLINSRAYASIALV